MSNSDGSGGRELRLVLAVNDFEHFLSASKGLSVSTRECYVRHVLAFLTEVGGDTAGVVDLGGVSAQRVRSYVTDLGGRYAPQSLRPHCDGDQVVPGVRMDVGWTGCDLRPAGCGGDPPVRPSSQDAARWGSAAAVGGSGPPDNDGVSGLCPTRGVVPAGFTRWRGRRVALGRLQLVGGDGDFESQGRAQVVPPDTSRCGAGSGGLLEPAPGRRCVP
jgi:hypothetical protein